MTRTAVASLDSHIGAVVTVCGWVETIRRQKERHFIVVRDHTGHVQAVHERAGAEPLVALLDALTPESVVRVAGLVRSDARAQPRGLELAIQDLDVVSRAASPLPLNRQSSLATRLDWRFLDLRRARNNLIFRIQTSAEHSMRAFWREHGFIEIHSPKFMASPSESGAELFRVEYFDRHAFLAQSPQFYKQMAMAAGFERVFEVGPVFRANPSFTSRHDTEFTSIDVELAWIDSHEDVMALEERWLSHVLRDLHAQHGDELRRTFGVELTVPEPPFPRLPLAEAQRVLEARGHHVARGKGDLDPEGERLLGEHVRATTGQPFVFVTDYPAEARPFYHMRHADAPALTRSFDLLWNGLEVTTGAQREHRYEVLVEQAREKRLRLESIQYYLDFFRYGCPPHGGYGFGLTRMLMVALGLGNVREVTYLYRGVHRLAP